MKTRAPVDSPTDGWENECGAVMVSHEETLTPQPSKFHIPNTFSLYVSQTIVRSCALRDKTLDLLFCSPFILSLCDWSSLVKIWGII